MNLVGRIILSASYVVSCFFSTDRAPKPDEYKYMTQGMILVGDIALTFTILTNDGQEIVITNALSMLKSSTHVNSDAT